MPLFFCIAAIVYGTVIALLPADLLWTLYLSVAAGSAVFRFAIPAKTRRGPFLHTPFSIIVDALEWPGSAFSRGVTISSLLAKIPITDSTRNAILTLQPIILWTPIAMLGIVGGLIVVAHVEGTTVQYGEMWLMFAVAGAANLADIALAPEVKLKQLRSSTRDVARILAAAILANVGLVLTAWAARVSSTSSIVGSQLPAAFGRGGRYHFLFRTQPGALWARSHAIDRWMIYAVAAFFLVIVFRLTARSKDLSRSVGDYANIGDMCCVLARFTEANSAAAAGLTIDPVNRRCLRVATIASLGQGDCNRALEIGERWVMPPGHQPEEFGTLCHVLVQDITSRLLPIRPHPLLALLQLMIEHNCAEIETTSLIQSLIVSSYISMQGIQRFVMTASSAPLICATVQFAAHDLQSAEKTLKLFIPENSIQKIHKEFLIMRLRWAQTDLDSNERNDLVRHLQTNLPSLAQELCAISARHKCLLEYSFGSWLTDATNTLQTVGLTDLAGAMNVVVVHIKDGDHNTLPCLSRGKHALDSEEAEMQHYETRFTFYHRTTLYVLYSVLTFLSLNPTQLRIYVALLIILSVYFDLFLPSQIIDLPPRQELRRPRFTPLCLLLSYHFPFNFAVNGIAFFLIGETAYQLFGAYSWKWYVSMLLGSYLSYYCLLRGVFAAVKAIIVGSTRIVVFRRFASTTAVRHKSTILPIMGAYGYLILYDDKTLLDLPNSPFWETEELLAGAHNYMRSGEPDWEHRVLVELNRADFAVFDWEDIPTPAMELELKLAVAILPVERLIWIVSNAKADLITQVVQRYLAVDMKDLNMISRDSGYWQLSSDVRCLISQSAKHLKRCGQLISS
jgi:hypothetical protein